MGVFSSRDRLPPEPPAPLARSEYSSSSGHSDGNTSRSNASTPRAYGSGATGRLPGSNPRPDHPRSTETESPRGASSTAGPRPAARAGRAEPSRRQGGSHEPNEGPAPRVSVSRADPRTWIGQGLTPATRDFLEEVQNRPMGAAPVGFPPGADPMQPHVRHFNEGNVQCTQIITKRELTEQEVQEMEERMGRMGRGWRAPGAGSDSGSSSGWPSVPSLPRLDSSSSGYGSSPNGTPRAAASRSSSPMVPPPISTTPRTASGSPQGTARENRNLSAGAASRTQELSRETRQQMRGFLDRKKPRGN